MAQTISLSSFMFNKLAQAKIEEKPVFKFKHRPYQLEVEKEFDSSKDNFVLYICWARRLTY